jgi:L-threonylcarbamoyladenylate synthase
VTIIPVTPESISHAAMLLRAGKLVAFPTETVYGLGADATSDSAVVSIYTAKERPQFNPLIIHVARTEALNDLIEWNDLAHRLATQFWPGPLTLVLPRKITSPVSLLASAGMATLAVRIPSHPIAQQLLSAVALPIAAPSANASGRLSSTTPSHVFESLGNKVDLILAGGKSQIGVESTILELISPKPVLLRPGSITREQLEKIVGAIDSVRDISSDDNEKSPRSPGMLASHYAPSLPLRLNASSVEPDEVLLAFGPDIFIKGGAMRLNLSEEGDLDEAAANLFSMLHRLDQPTFRCIAVMPVPDVGLGVAINDRLMRASTR